MTDDEQLNANTYVNTPLYPMVFSRLPTIAPNVNPIARHIDCSSMRMRLNSFVDILYTDYAKNKFTIYHRRTGERIVVHLTDLGEFQCGHKETKVSVPQI